MDPDGPKTCGSGSGPGTLVDYIFGNKLLKERKKERKKVSLDVALPGGLVAECAAALGALVRDGRVNVAVVTPQRRGVREFFVTAW